MLARAASSLITLEKELAAVRAELAALRAKLQGTEYALDASHIREAGLRRKLEAAEEAYRRAAEAYKARGAVIDHNAKVADEVMDELDKTTTAKKQVSG